MVMQGTTEMITDEWCQVLGIDFAEPYDNFFSLGGDSLMVLRLTRRLEDRLHGQFPLTVLYLDGTVSAAIDACYEAARNSGPSK